VTGRRGIEISRLGCSAAAGNNAHRIAASAAPSQAATAGMVRRRYGVERMPS